VTNYKRPPMLKLSRKRIGKLVRRSLLIICFIFLITSRVVSQDVSPGQDYFAEAVVDNATPYVGQQITYRFRFYDAIDVTNPQYEAPDFEGFWRIEKESINRVPQQINNRQYMVTELTTSLYPARPGIINISPAKVLLPETVFRAEEEVIASIVTVDVRPLPEGAPDGFTGAVGQFELSATLDRQSAPLGVPFILRLAVTGTGNVEQLTLPDLPVPSDWRIYSNPTTFVAREADGVVVGEKVYEYLLVPGQVGSQTFSGVTFHYFDPNNALYRSINTQSVMLEVLPSSETAIQPSPDTTAITLTPQATLLPLKPITGEIQKGTISLGFFFGILWLLPPLGLAGCWWWVWQQKREQLRLRTTRGSRALEQAQTRLRNVSKISAPETYHHIRKAIMNYFGDKLNRQGDNLSDTDLAKILADTNLPPNLSKRILLCLEWADEGQYAPIGTIDLLTLVTRTSETLTVLDSAWK
jgi:hypothetical protein